MLLSYSTYLSLINDSQGPSFPGLLGYVNKYLDTLNEAPKEKSKLSPYLGLIRARADGKRS